MTCSFYARWIVIRALAVVSLAVAFSSSGANVAHAEDAQQRFSAHLAAGEFGPAWQIANQANGGRDAMLLQLAQAQARAGGRHAALSTAADIRNDRERYSAFSELGKQPVPGGARGGAALADFDTLIELIQMTIAPDTWADAGGVGAVESFPGGVYVDSAGTLKRLDGKTADPVLERIRSAALSAGGNRDVRQKSLLRKVSLTRLERYVQWLAAQGKSPDAAMRSLAGLTRVQYVFVYPETRDIVIAGPAGDWQLDEEGRFVNSESRQPTLQLDDFVVLLRNAITHGGRFSCSINPRQENLAGVQAFLSESAKKPVKPGGRDDWIRELHDRLGIQDIVVQGLDPRTRVARILVEADYRMKLVGMGLEPGVLGVRSYLDSIEVPPGGEPPPIDVLRWWFTLNYEAVRATAERDAFQFSGSGVKVLSENELLTERGERVHTGDSKNLNRIFAQSFTRHFDALSRKYPIYAELRNIFDLALVAGIIRHEDLAGPCDWQMTGFGEQGNYTVELGAAPRQVASVINHRELDRKHFIVGVSGGVSVDAGQIVRPANIKTDTYGLLKAESRGAAPPALPKTAWWWD